MILKGSRCVLVCVEVGLSVVCLQGCREDGGTGWEREVARETREKEAGRGEKRLWRDKNGASGWDSGS